MNIQPGTGYNFTASSSGYTLDTSDPFPSSGVNQKTYQQFECKIESETVSVGGTPTTKFYLKTRKGVVNYTWSSFPFYPSEEPLGDLYGGEVTFQMYQKQARINDWAVYQNGKRTAGTATDGPEFEWMADNGKIELPAGASGKSMLVLMSKIDWYDKEYWLEDYRLIDAEMPFVSVIDTSDTTAMDTLAAQQGASVTNGKMLWFSGTVGGNRAINGLSQGEAITIGYTYKKIAQLDWNDTTNTWDIAQYEYGPMNVFIPHLTSGMGIGVGNPPTPSAYEQAVDNEFSGCTNYAWFENTWAIPGHTLNPDDWWTHLVNT